MLPGILAAILTKTSNDNCKKDHINLHDMDGTSVARNGGSKACTTIVSYKVYILILRPELAKLKV